MAPINRLTSFILLIVFIAACNGNEPNANEIEGVNAETVSTFTEDGAWCWFQDPRAVYFDGTHRRTYSGWMTKSGQLVVAQFDHDTKQIDTLVLKEEWDINDHNTPSFLVRPDGHIMVFYARHNKVGLFTKRSLRPEDITAWGDEITVSDEDRITYSHPVQLKAENNRLYVFWRGPSWKPTFAYSDDGITWSDSQILIQQQGREAADIRPYLKVVSDSDSTIHFTFTNGHPRNEPANSVYYMKYLNGQFYKADGTPIGTLDQVPVDHAGSDLVYDGADNGARAWVWDIALDAAGHPRIAYTRLPQETDHRYHYAYWDGASWADHFVSNAGGWFPQTQPGEDEPEVHYSGGITINQHTPSVLYFAHEKEGQFELSRAETFDQGSTWTIEPITESSSGLNVRPVFPHGYTGAEDHVLWMEGQYIHYTNYQTAIRFLDPATLP